MNANNTEKVDLMADPDNLPKEVADIINKYDADSIDYEMCDQIVKELNAIGYHANYDLGGYIYDVWKFTDYEVAYKRFKEQTKSDLLYFFNKPEHQGLYIAFNTGCAMLYQNEYIMVTDGTPKQNARLEQQVKAMDLPFGWMYKNLLKIKQPITIYEYKKLFFAKHGLVITPEMQALRDNDKTQKTSLNIGEYVYNIGTKDIVQVVAKYGAFTKIYNDCGEYTVPTELLRSMSIEEWKDWEAECFEAALEDHNPGMYR